jgi:hypothetical protein
VAPVRVAAPVVRLARAVVSAPGAAAAARPGLAVAAAASVPVALAAAVASVPVALAAAVVLAVAPLVAPAVVAVPDPSSGPAARRSAAGARS